MGICEIKQAKWQSIWWIRTCMYAECAQMHMQKMIKIIARRSWPSVDDFDEGLMWNADDQLKCTTRDDENEREREREGEREGERERARERQSK